MLDSETLRNRVARIIACTRFPFVDQENWPRGRRTLVNDEEKRFAVHMEGETFYPSIVVLEAGGGVREIGLVETREEVAEGSLPRWRALSQVCSKGRAHRKLFLYVPRGLEEKAQRLLEDGGVDYDGIRGYHVENQFLRVTPFETRNDEYDHAVT